VRAITLAFSLLLPLACASQVQNAAVPLQNAPAVGNEGNRAQMQDRLQLTTAQLDYWVRFASSLDAYSKLFYEEKPIAAYASDSAPRQFAHLTDSLQNHLAALEDIERAAKDLYAVLSPNQQTIANQWLVSTVPVFASAANCVATDGKALAGKRDTPQHGRRGSGMGGGPGNQVQGQF